MQVIPCSKYIFSVYDAGKKYIVCIERKICSCGWFQIDEISYSHAIAALKTKNVTNLHSYCLDYYKPKALSNTYELAMVSMSGREDWTAPKHVLEEIVLPPKVQEVTWPTKEGYKEESWGKYKGNRYSLWTMWP